MIAPYQEMAKQFNSPYAMFRPNSWIAQNHPMATKMLDAAGLSMAMTPGPQGPEGVGGGISRAMQGVLGANQYRREMMLRSAMLPYQMMMPRLQAEDTMSQIMERRGSALRAEAYWNRMANQEQEYLRRDATERATKLQQSKYEQQMVYGSIPGLPRNEQGEYDEKKFSPEQWQAIANKQIELRQGEHPGRESMTETDKIYALMYGKGATPESYQAGLKREDIAKQLAGVKSAGSAEGRESTQADLAFMAKAHDDARTSLLKDQPKEKDSIDFQMEHSQDPKWNARIKAVGREAAFGEYKKEWDDRYAQFQDNWTRYQGSSAWQGKNKLGFNEWLKRNPTGQGGQAAPATSGGGGDSSGLPPGYHFNEYNIPVKD
jgi:hypothetical protein